jgi:peptide/nickel transport system permease protein
MGVTDVPYSEATARRRQRELPASVQQFLYVLQRSRPAILGLAITLLFVFIAIFAPFIATHDPLATNPAEQFQPPSPEHFMGTDEVGWDIFSRAIYATRIDFFIAITSVSLAMVIGVPLGALAGYFSGRFDDLLMRALDSVQAFPPLILAMAITAALGRSTWLVIGVIAFLNFPGYVRIVRAEIKSKKESLFCEAARSVGNSRWRIVFRHLLPNCLDAALARAPLNAGWAILVAASLSFIGLGVPIPIPEWGAMISTGTNYVITGEWWISFFPGLVIVLAVLGLNLLAEGLCDIIDPKRMGM